MKSESEVTQSCPTLCNPWTVAHQVPLSMGFPKQEYWSGLPFPSPGDLHTPGMKPASPALADRFFITESPGAPIFNLVIHYSIERIITMKSNSSITILKFPKIKIIVAFN